LRYKEVLYNLAALADNPAVLPAYSSIAAGTTTISDTGTVTPTTVIGREVLKAGTITHFQSQTLDVMDQRRVSQNWSLDPVAVPEKLQAIRFACLWVLGGPQSLPPEAMFLLGRYDETKCMPPGHYFNVADELAKLPSGWLQVGSWKDVPLKAAYKAQCGGTWVWVCADGMEGLTAFTLVLHNIARTDTDSTFHPTADVRTIVKQGEVEGKTVKVTAYVDKNGNLVTGAGAYVAGFPFKKRIDDIGSNAFTRSIIAASGSKGP
jgi:hypothetical protein